MLDSHTMLICLAWLQDSGLKVTSEFTLGNAIQIILLICGIGGFYGKFTALQTKVDLMYTQWVNEKRHCSNCGNFIAKQGD